MNDAQYTPQHISRSEFVTLRGHRHHVRIWGDAADVTPEQPPLVLVHGWMDTSASFQFVVDELARLSTQPRYVLAPDWRGFGLTQSPPTDCYWYPDYLADLDALLDHLVKDQPVDLLGHSMGGNVVMAFAAVRPQRIRRLINLEGYGLPSTRPEQAPKRLRQWLDELKSPSPLKTYDSLAGVAARLMKNNPRLPQYKADWLAAQWAVQRDDGRWHILGDPAHMRINPTLHRAEETLACWRAIEAPLLWVESDSNDMQRYWGDRFPHAEFEARLGVVAQVERVRLPGCGHMLHHDQPERLAEHIARFLA